MSEEIKLTKKTLILVIGVIIILALGLTYYFIILPAQQKKTAIEGYKKALYDSIVCQYECPLQNYTIDNRTQTIQQRECVLECINQLKAKGYVRDQFSNNEINSDNLAKDIESEVIRCRNEGVSETGEQDIKSITDCAIEGLEALKSVYPYLN